jgi:hypothetical protein
MNKDVDQATVQQRRLDLDREAKTKGVVDETVTDTRAGMARIYRRLAPKIERHRDSFLAGQLYDELEDYAELHGAEAEFKRMMNGARNRAHMDYDTNPGGFQNWFWYLPFEDSDMSEGDEQLLEGIKDTASATAVIACLLAGGNLSGCATAPQQTTTAQIAKTGQDLGRIVYNARNITRAGTQEEAQQEEERRRRGEAATIKREGGQAREAGSQEATARASLQGGGQELALPPPRLIGCWLAGWLGVKSCLDALAHSCTFL